MRDIKDMEKPLQSRIEEVIWKNLCEVASKKSYGNRSEAAPETVFGSVFPARRQRSSHAQKKSYRNCKRDA